MTHRVGVDRSQTRPLQKTTHLALARPKTPRDQPTSVPRSHNGRR
jgi:hypothetical protein